ncbi:MAG TPA: hypothetical protein VNG29_02215, partial [Candidatus Paceibacterota bacterium]|nr:hypothetical protein [Candidatus Paceibacterota bacterium]
KFNQNQGKVIIIPGSNLPTANNVDVSTVTLFSITGENSAFFGSGLDRSADGRLIIASSGGAAYVVRMSDLLIR